MKKTGFCSIKHENSTEKFMTDELSQLISRKNYSDLHEKYSSPVLMNSETNGTTLLSYFKSKMAGNKCKIIPDSTVNSILI